MTLSFIPEAERIRRMHIAQVIQATEDVQAAKAALNQAVANARATGLSWNRIALAAGITRQAARQRWGC